MHAPALDRVLGVVLHPQIFEMLFQQRGQRRLRRLERFTLTYDAGHHATTVAMRFPGFPGKTPFGACIHAGFSDPAKWPSPHRFGPVLTPPTRPSEAVRFKSYWSEILAPESPVHRRNSGRGRRDARAGTPSPAGGPGARAAACALQPRVLAHVRRLKRKSARSSFSARIAAHHLVDQQQQPPRLRRQLVERAAEHLGRQPVGDRDVVRRRLDVLERPVAPVFTGRWCWCSSAMVRISVRYFM